MPKVQALFEATYFAGLRKAAEFGRSSEQLARDIAQLELAIEAVETDRAERLAAQPPAVAAMIEPAGRLLPEHLPREEVVHPAPCTCPSCGGALRKIGADVTETLDYVPGRFKVVRHVRDKLARRACDTVVQTPAPYHPIARGRAGAGLLAHIVVSKYETICHFIARPRSTPARVSSWRPRPCRAGSAPPRQPWRR